MVRLNFSLIVGLSIATSLFSQVVAASPDSAAARANPRPPKVLDTFCSNFDRACADVCLKGKKGKQTIAYVCSKVPPKNKIYHFACHCNGKDKTQAALNKVAGPPPSTTTTTSTVSETSTVTSLEPTTITTTILTGSISTVTTVTLVGSQDFGVNKDSNNKDSNVFQNVLVEKKVSLVQVDVAKKQTNKKPKKTKTTFCKEYSSACDRQCSRVKSSTKEETCKKTRDGLKSDSYSLYCKCKNGKLETQHALADVGTEEETVTVVGTTTETETVTSTITVPVATSTTTSYTATDLVSTTTLIVVAPTGRVRADGLDKKNFGYVGKGSDQQNILGVYSPGSSAVSKVFLVQDKDTGNYEIGFSLQPDRFWKLGASGDNSHDFLDQSPQNQNTWTYLNQGSSVPPPSTSATDFSQTFSWKLGSLLPNSHIGDSSITSSLFEYDLTPRWIQRNGNFVELSFVDFASVGSDTGLFAVVPGSYWNTYQSYKPLKFFFEPEVVE